MISGDELFDALKGEKTPRWKTWVFWIFLIIVVLGIPFSIGLYMGLKNHGVI